MSCRSRFLASFICFISAGGVNAYADDFFALEYEPQTNLFLAIQAPAKQVVGGHLPTYVLSRAETHADCPGPLPAVVERIFNSLQPGQRSDFWRTLMQVDRNIETRLRREPVAVGLDHFKFIQYFQSVYIPSVQDRAVISLDCRLLRSQAWRAQLGHELVHHVLARRGLPSWFEEMAAQAVELEFLPEQIGKVNSLQALTLLPSPYSESRPFRDLQAYAINVLLMKYLQQLFGAAEVFQTWQAVAFDESPCPHSLALIDRVLCDLQARTTSGPRDLKRGITDSQMLQRHFIAALVMNLRGSGEAHLFSVAGWPGFRSKPQKNWPVHLNQGEFVRLRGDSLKNYVPSPENEVFRLLWRDNLFLILTGDDIWKPDLWKQHHAGSPANDEVIVWGKLTDKMY